MYITLGSEDGKLKFPCLVDPFRRKDWCLVLLLEAHIQVAGTPEATRADQKISV